MEAPALDLLRDQTAMKYLKLSAVLGFTLALGGCANNGAQTSPPSSASIEAAPQPGINAQTHYAAGQLAESRGDFDSAIAQYRETLSLEPKNTKALYRIGCIQAQQKKYAESIATWKKYLELTNNSATGYNNLAFTEELAGNPAGAEADYRRGIAKEPSNGPCRVNFGLMLARNGRIGDATIQLQAVLPPAQVHYNLATVYEMQHTPQKAKIEYREAVALDPNFADARTRLTDLGDLAPEGASDKGDLTPDGPSDDVELAPDGPSEKAEMAPDSASGSDDTTPDANEDKKDDD